MPAKPTIVLIPGACTEASCFDRLTPYLHDAGYETVAVSHPSANPPDPFAHTAETMALNVQNTYVQPLLDAGKDVLVYAYSSGGSQTGTNGPSWVKSEREREGQKGGVVGIVYHSCAPVPAGTDQLTFMGGAWPPFIKADVPAPGLFVFDPIIPHLFNDADPAEQEELAKTAIPHAERPIKTPVLPPLWADSALDGRRIWLKAMLDGTFAPEVAQAFIDGSGVEWEVVERDVGHCGCVTMPKIVAEVILNAAEKYAV